MTQEDPFKALSAARQPPAQTAPDLLGEEMPASDLRAVPDGRECLARTKSEVFSLFGGAMVSVLQPYLREIGFVQRRDSLSEPEKSALGSLVSVHAFLNGMAESENGILKPIGGSGDIFLRDVFYALLDRENDRAGNPLLLRATVCPDYETDGQGHYTSRGALGQNPGLCAEKTVEALKPLLAELSAHNLPVVLELCYADIEALDPIMLQKSKTEDVADFQRRVDESGRRAEERFRAEFSEQQLNVAVRAGSMRRIIGDSAEPNISERLKAVAIGSSQIGGIASHRSTFYSSFFADQYRGRDVGEFYAQRAAKDIDDHVRLGQAAALDRRQGERVSIVTMSIPALAKYLRHGSDSVPVLTVRQDY